MVRSLLLLLLIAPGSIEGSHCMATDCSNIGTGLSLYLRVCCVNSNLGQGVKMRENNINKYILCPSVRPRSCPGKLYCVCIIIILNLVDCKSWFAAGYNINGVYTINPDEQTPFEVRG